MTRVQIAGAQKNKLQGLTLRVLSERFAICRLPSGDSVPSWFRPSALSSLTYTHEELSLVVPEQSVPDEVKAERSWRCLGVVGPLDFGLTGVLASIAVPLAEAGISICAMSTYDTDYMLVRAEAFDAALKVLSGRFEFR